MTPITSQPTSFATEFNLQPFLYNCKAKIRTLNDTENLHFTRIIKNFANRKILSLTSVEQLFTTKTLLTSDELLQNVSRISFNPNDNQPVFLNKDATQILTKNYKVIETPSELKKIYSISHDSQGDLHIAGIKQQQLCIWINNQSLGADNWKEITNVLVDVNNIDQVSLSDDSSFLFVLTKDNQLKVFNKTTNWSNIKTISEIKNFPVDIDSFFDMMIFIDNKKLQITSLKNDINFTIDFKNSINTACFIPNTEDLFVFDSSGKITLLKKSDTNKQSYDIKSQENLGYIVEKACFDPNDNNKLVLLTNFNKDINFYLLFIPYTSLIAGIIGAFGGSIAGAVNFCNTQGSLVCCTTGCLKETAITSLFGTGAGIGAGCVLSSLISVIMYAEEETTYAKIVELEDSTNNKKLEI